MEGAINRGSNRSNAAGLGARLICAKCVDNQYLTRELGRVGKEGNCSYGHGESKTLTVEHVADLIKGALEERYEKVVEVKEKNSISDTQSMSVTGIIMGLVGAEESLANDLQVYLMQEHKAKLESENPFDRNALYKLDDSLLFSWEEQWAKLKNDILKESRFFNKKVENNLKLMIDGISKLTPKKGTSFINEYDEGKFKVFRARVFQSSSKLKDALRNPVQYLGPPPSRLAKDGRLNARGIAAFYGATDPVLAIAEVRPPVNSEVVVAAYENVRKLRLLDIEELEYIVKTSLLDPSYEEKAPIEEFLANLGDMISAPVMPDDESFDYLITQAVADYLSERDDLAIDGILYRSTQMKVNKNKKNVVLFYKSALIEPRDASEVIEVDEKIIDNNKTNYTIIISKEDKIYDSVNCRSDNETDVGQEDSRDISLRLDISKMFVRNIESVRFFGRRKKIERKEKRKPRR